MLCLFLVLVTVALLNRGWVRGVALAAALPCLPVLALASWFGIERVQRNRATAAFEAKVRQVLDQDAVVDGLPLPRGTALRWQDVDHSQLDSAAPPEPVTLFGLRVTWVHFAPDDGGWDLQLTEPQLLDGWTCDKVGVRVSPVGRLRSCQLAAERHWHGWPIPAESFLDLAEPGKVGLAMPTGASMPAPEIGHPITATGGFAFNDDGSLDRFYFTDEDPLVVAGRRLWNTVQWSYDPATHGQGRQRPALTVRGYVASGADAGTAVVIDLSTGRATSAE